MTKLTDPFPFEAVSYRVVATSGDKKRGQIAFYLNARDVMNRLDEIDADWSDAYRPLAGKNVECQLTVNGRTRCDVGEPNEGGQADPMKSAYSDAFKRAAVKFGIGRYLYESERIWVDLDDRKQPKPTEVKRIRDAYERLVSGETPEPVSAPAAEPNEPRADWNAFSVWANEQGYEWVEIVRLRERVRIEQGLARPELWGESMVRRLKATIAKDPNAYKKREKQPAGA